jgi:hypothetical protein
MNRPLRNVMAALLIMLPAAASVAADIAVHRDPSCGCCEKWAAQLRAAFGRPVVIVDEKHRAEFRQANGVPATLASCHTALIDGMVFEGHVPVEDIRRVLAERPKGVTGLAVKGMPMGSPGMEAPGGVTQPYDVMTFGPAGERIYAHRD